jgi:LysM repeat protein
VGYYNGGDIELMDANGVETTVNAKTDLMLAGGYSRKMGKLSVGLTGKYISSELIEQAKATAFAADLGLMISAGRLNFGAAVQNIGSKLTYETQGSDLPRIARLGMSAQILRGALPTMLMIDAPYHMNEAELRPGVGLEVMTGPLALRAGYKKQDGLQQLSFGAGFLINTFAFDYSYGLVDELDSSHRMSMGLRFGSEKPKEIVKQPRMEEKQSILTTEFKTAAKKGEAVASLGQKSYIVKAGDTLGKIARQQYGNSQAWQKIYSANQHLLDGSKTLEVGQRIVLP